MASDVSGRIDPRYFVETAARAFELLNAIEATGGPTTLGEMSAKLGWNKPTTYRLLRTLEAIGILRQTAAKSYYLGPSLISLGLAALRATKLAEVASPYLRRIATETGETTVLAVLDGHDVVYVGRIDSDEILLSPRLELGSRLPAHITATGKMLLSVLSEDELRNHMKRCSFPPYGPKAIRSIEELSAALVSVRDRGYALTEDELTLGHRAAATPIFDHTGASTSSIGISASGARMSKSRLTRIVTTVLIPTAAQISADLGYSGVSF